MRNEPLAPSVSPGDLPVALPCSLLLACFADFYEEIASIKRAHRDGRLAAHLAQTGEELPVDGSEFATRVNARLATLLRQQRLDFQRHGGVAEGQAHRAALYVMTALADEIFLLELEWPGSEAWVGTPLEQVLFGTCRSGQGFFDLADQLIKAQSGHPLHADLAAVFLLALQLGFKGVHRGRGGHDVLSKYRQQLFLAANGDNRKYLLGSSAGQADDRNVIGEHMRDGRREGHRHHIIEGEKRHAFFQAYQHRVVDGKDERLAPLSTWWKLSKAALITYLVLSTAIWFIAFYPVEKILTIFGG